MQCCPCNEFNENEEDFEDDFDCLPTESSTECPSEECCCQCCPQKKQQNAKKRGKFGLAYVMQSPKFPDCQPCGWQLEFNDTPAQVERSCRQMLKWVNSPPLMDNGCSAPSNRKRNSSPPRNRVRCCSPCSQRRSPNVPQRSQPQCSPVRRRPCSPMRQSSPMRQRPCSPMRQSRRSPTRRQRGCSPSAEPTPVILYCVPNPNETIVEKPVCCKCCCSTPSPINQMPSPINQMPTTGCCCNGVACKMCSKPIETNTNCCKCSNGTANQPIIDPNTNCCKCSNGAANKSITPSCGCSSQNNQTAVCCRCTIAPQAQSYNKCCQPKNFLESINNNVGACKNPCCPEIFKEEDQCMCLSKGDKLCCDCLGNVFEKLQQNYRVCQACANVYPKTGCCKRYQSDGEYDYIPRRDTEKDGDCPCCSDRNRNREERERRSSRRPPKGSRDLDDKPRRGSRRNALVDDMYDDGRYNKSSKRFSKTSNKDIENIRRSSQLDEIPTKSDRRSRSFTAQNGQTQTRYEEPVKEVPEKGSKIGKIMIGTGSKATADKIEEDPKLPQGSVLIQLISEEEVPSQSSGEIENKE